MIKKIIWIIIIGVVILGATMAKPKVAVVTLPSPAPSPIPLESSEQISPDGTHMVKLKKRGRETEILVNEQKVANLSGSELLIPFNTWSPDNKYFFLKETSEVGDDYLVYKTRGELDTTIAELFKQAYPDNTITEVTGWAAPTLMLVNAKSTTDNKMSYWFDVQTHKFIRLSSYFN